MYNQGYLIGKEQGMCGIIQSQESGNDGEGWGLGADADHHPILMVEGDGLADRRPIHGKAKLVLVSTETI